MSTCLSIKSFRENTNIKGLKIDRIIRLIKTLKDNSPKDEKCSATI